MSGMEINPDVHTNWSRNELEQIVKDVLVQEGILGMDGRKSEPIDPRPSAEAMAGLIIERDKAIKRADGLVNSLKGVNEARKRAVDLNAEYLNQLKKMEDSNAEMAEKLNRIFHISK